MKTENNNSKMKKKFFRPGVFATLLVVVTLFWIVYTHAQPTSINGNSITDNSGLTEGDVQIIKIHVEGANYVLEPSTIKKGVPVRIEADMSRMPGCSRSVVISEFGVRKTFTDTNNVLEFTPTKAGTFNIACSMNMYKGTFEVLESDGTKSSYVQPASKGGMTCGAGGGCGGCGGSR